VLLLLLLPRSVLMNHQQISVEKVINDYLQANKIKSTPPLQTMHIRRDGDFNVQ